MLYLYDLSSGTRQDNLMLLFLLAYCSPIPHAHAGDEYRACDRAHVPRRDVHAHASGLGQHQHGCEMGLYANDCARELKPCACANEHVVR